jgi:hypothetical protein
MILGFVGCRQLWLQWLLGLQIIQSKFFSKLTNIVILQADAGWMMTVRLSGKTPRLELVLDGIHDDKTLVEELLRRACAALGVQAGAKVVLRCESRLLKAGDTLAEAGVSARDVLDIGIGEDGGMRGVGEKMRRMLFEELAHDVSGIEGALQRLTTVQKGAATRRVAVEVPAYGGEYLELIVALVKKGQESSDACASRTEELTKQLGVLQRLTAAMEVRESTDALLCAGASDETDSELRGVSFDASVDDDEVLLRLFREVDDDGNGNITMAELLKAPILQKKENSEMARVLRRSLGCDLQALEEALESLKEKDFAPYAQRSAGALGESEKFDRGAAVKIIFDAVMPSLQAAVPPEVHQAATGDAADMRMATRADLIRFLVAEEAPARGSALAKALEKLASALPADGQLDFLALKAAARKVPRVVAQRLEWVRTMGLDAALARHLPPGTLEDGCAPKLPICLDWLEPMLLQYKAGRTAVL